MSALPPELARLSAIEKIELIGLLLESIHDEEMPIPGFRREFVRTRLDDLRRNPTRGPAWEDLRAELERVTR